MNNWIKIERAGRRIIRLVQDKFSYSEIKRTQSSPMEQSMHNKFVDFKSVLISSEKNCRMAVFWNNIDICCKDVITEYTIDFDQDADAMENVLRVILCLYTDPDKIIKKNVALIEGRYQLHFFLLKCNSDTEWDAFDNKMGYLCKDYKDMVRISKSLFSKNNLRNFFLVKNVDVRDKFKKRIQQYKNTLICCGFPLDQTCIVGGAVLELFGIKNSDDIDFVTIKNLRKKYGTRGMELAPGIDLAYENYIRKGKKVLVTDTQLICDDSNHFIFMGCKFANLEYVYYRKVNSSRKKDI